MGSCIEESVLVPMTYRSILESPSKTLAIVLAMFCFGILLGPLVPQDWWEGLLIMSAIFGAMACVLPKREVRFVCVLTAVFFFALFRYTQAGIPIDTPSVGEVPSSDIRVSGVIDAEVERRMDGQRIILDRVSYADDSREGRLLMWAPLYPEVQYGDELVFNCRVESPEAFEGFAYDRYLATQGIVAVCYQPQFIDVHPSESWSVIGAILVLKDWATGTLYAILPEPHASFLSGLLFGGSTALSSELKDDFRATGTSHILAASGFNVSIFSVAFLSFILSTKIGRKRGLLLTWVLLAVYVVIAGASAAVVRAGIMGGLVVLEHWISRKAYMLNAFLLTGSLMLLFNPLILQDVGFQLSFVATIAIISFTKPVSQRLTFIPEVIGLRESFAASLTAIVLTLPIVLWHFGAISLVAPFANLLVLPLVPYAMAVTGISILVGGVILKLGILVSLPAWAFSYVMLRIVSAFGSIPFAVSEPEHSRLLAVIMTGVFISIWFIRRYAPSRT